MNHDQLLALGVPLADKLVRTVVVYLGIALALRLAGKRDLAQLNSFDLVVTLLLANVVQNAIIGPDNSLIGGLVGVAVLLTINSAVVRFVSRHDWAVRMFEGGNTTLVKDGRYIESALRREGLRKADIEVALRQQNANGPEEVAEATLTPGGAIIVWLKPQAMAARRNDLDVLRQRVDDLERRLSDKLDLVLADTVTGALDPRTGQN
ncbi:MAG TPA: YetF domain-containing protein [Actinomycetota bacterium]|jgi:uncharacterized membrane protein YcaP (DUF421 family)|nr:YetF domain-containing protein [Actinomycetota bacterium]